MGEDTVHTLQPTSLPPELHKSSPSPSAASELPPQNRDRLHCSLLKRLCDSLDRTHPLIIACFFLLAQCASPESVRLESPLTLLTGNLVLTLWVFGGLPAVYGLCSRLWGEADRQARLSHPALVVTSTLMLKAPADPADGPLVVDPNFLAFLAEEDRPAARYREPGGALMSLMVSAKVLREGYVLGNLSCVGVSPAVLSFCGVNVLSVFFPWRVRSQSCLWRRQMLRMSVIIAATVYDSQHTTGCFDATELTSYGVMAKLFGTFILNPMHPCCLTYALPLWTAHVIIRLSLHLANYEWQQLGGPWAALDAKAWWTIVMLAVLPAVYSSAIFYAVRYAMAQGSLLRYLRKTV